MTIPESTFLITGVAVLLGVVSQVATRRFVDLKKERRIRAEVTEYRKELREAMRTGNKAKEEKLKKKEKQMRTLEFQLSSGRMKVSFLFFAPFIIIYYLTGNFLGGFEVIVAIAPVEIPYISSLAKEGVFAGKYVINFFWWYFLSSLSFSSILSKITGTGMT